MWFREAERVFLLPLGKIQWWLLDEVATVLRQTFGKETIHADEMPPPREALDRERGQACSTALIEAMARSGPRGMILGMTDLDIFVPGLDFVFGEADPAEGVAVISIARLREEFHGREADQGLLLSRTIKAAMHEMGHLYGLKHCPDPSCVMGHSGSVEEKDRKNKDFCSLCRLRIKKSTD